MLPNRLIQLPSPLRPLYPPLSPTYCLFFVPILSCRSGPSCTPQRVRSLKTYKYDHVKLLTPQSTHPFLISTHHFLTFRTHRYYHIYLPKKATLLCPRCHPGLSAIQDSSRIFDHIFTRHSIFITGHVHEFVHINKLSYRARHNAPSCGCTRGG